MSEKITIELDEAKQVYELLDKLNAFLHQPMNYENIDAFGTEVYPELREAYYRIVWSWLPRDVQKAYEER